MTKNWEHSTGDVVTVTIGDIARLEALALADPLHKYRLCVNPTAADAISEMIIVHTDQTIVPIHRHHLKSESFHFLKGFADVVLYHDDGTVRQVIPMGPYGYMGRIPFYRLNGDIYHTLEILSPVVVFHECTNGPWHKEDLIIAPFWKAPPGWTR